MINKPSRMLNAYNLPHAVFGHGYNFRQSHGETQYLQSLETALNGMGIHPQRLYHGNQVHGNRVTLVGDRDITHETGTLYAGHPLIDETDGFITNRKGTALLIKMADCTPLIIYDPNNHAMAAIHSGWRGTVKEISAKALFKMQILFGTKPEEVLVYIGPCIDQAHYQVGSDVYDAFEAIGDRDHYFKGSQDGKYFLSMVKANVQVLLKAGVQEEKIDISPLSTYTSQDLHSARYQGPHYQLNALITYLP